MGHFFEPIRKFEGPSPPAPLPQAGEGGSDRLVVVAAWILIILLALAFRLPRLDLRPMHCDEANQAVRTGILQSTGVYRYDPQEHHGPSLYWLTLPMLWLRGTPTLTQASELDFRLVPVLFGVGLLLLLPLLADGLGRPAIWLAGLFTAVSPALVYYARDYIQETLLVFFTLAAIAAGWRYCRRPGLAWAATAGAMLGLMHATKETWILAGAAMGAALGAELVWTRRETGAWPNLRPFLRLPAVLSFLFSAVLVVLIFYSSCGQNWRGPLDSLLAYANYAHKAGSNDVHTHPWHYYLQLLVAYRPQRGFFWSEGLIVGLAAIGVLLAFFRRPAHGASVTPRSSSPALVRFLAVYALTLTVLYSAIPYKTPWCLLSFLQALTLLAGFAAATLLAALRNRAWRAMVAVALLLGVAQLAQQCYALNFRFYSDARNPYVYADTSTDVRHLAAQLQRLAQVSPAGRQTAVHVVTPQNYWPLPWYLRQFDAAALGYWPDPTVWATESARLPPPAAIILTPDAQAAVDAGLRAAYNKQTTFGLRPGELYYVYVRADLWPALCSH